MTLRLYVVPASHPCLAVEQALEYKGLDYKVTELPQGVHLVHQRLRFGKSRVPSMKLDGGEKVSGSVPIMRRLEELKPEPPLYPADKREAVERAEEWGHDVFQEVSRRILWWALRRRPDAMASYVAQARIPFPKPLVAPVGRVIAPLEWRLNGVSDEAVKADVAALPDHLAEVDRLVDAGVIGGEQPNAADLQIGSTLAQLRTLGDLTPLIDGSRGADLARRWFAGYPGAIPPGTVSV
jgi:glutathione S-transferase